MRRVLILSSACLLACAMLLLWGFAGTGGQKTQSEPLEVLLLVAFDTGSFPMQLRKGLQEAVQGLGGRLSVETPAGIPPDAPDDAFMPYDAVCLLMPQPKALLDKLKRLSIPAILLGEEVRGESCVIFDEEEGARQLGLLAARTYPAGSLHIWADVADPVQALRLKGLLKAFEGRQTLIHAGAALPGQLDDAACLIALSGGKTQQAAARKSAGTLPGALPLYSFDGGETSVKLMEDGLLQAAAASSPYAMGYTAGAMLGQLHSAQLKPSLRLVALRLVTPETLYDADNVKEMFPLLQ